MTAAFNYARAKATADRLIARFGRSLALRRVPADAEYDTDEGTSGFDPTDDSNDEDVTVAILPDQSTGNKVSGDQQFAMGSLVVTASKRALIAVGDLATAPKNGDLIVDVDTGTRYTIAGLTPLAPGGIDVLYKAELQA